MTIDQILDNWTFADPTFKTIIKEHLEDVEQFFASEHILKKRVGPQYKLTENWPQEWRDLQMNSKDDVQKFLENATEFAIKQESVLSGEQPVVNEKEQSIVDTAENEQEISETPELSESITEGTDLPGTSIESDEGLQTEFDFDAPEPMQEIDSLQQVSEEPVAFKDGQGLLNLENSEEVELMLPTGYGVVFEQENYQQEVHHIIESFQKNMQEIILETLGPSFITKEALEAVANNIPENLKQGQIGSEEQLTDYTQQLIGYYQNEITAAETDPHYLANLIERHKAQMGQQVESQPAKQEVKQKEKQEEKATDAVKSSDPIVAQPSAQSIEPILGTPSKVKGLFNVWSISGLAVGLSVVFLPAAPLILSGLAVGLFGRELLAVGKEISHGLDEHKKAHANDPKPAAEKTNWLGLGKVGTATTVLAGGLSLMTPLAPLTTIVGAGAAAYWLGNKIKKLYQNQSIPAEEKIASSKIEPSINQDVDAQPATEPASIAEKEEKPFVSAAEEFASKDSLQEPATEPASIAEKEEKPFVSAAEEFASKDSLQEPASIAKKEEKPFVSAADEFLAKDLISSVVEIKPDTSSLNESVVNMAYKGLEVFGTLIHGKPLTEAAKKMALSGSMTSIFPNEFRNWAPEFKDELVELADKIVSKQISKDEFTINLNDAWNRNQDLIAGIPNGQSVIEKLKESHQQGSDTQSLLDTKAPRSIKI